MHDCPPGNGTSKSRSFRALAWRRAIFAYVVFGFVIFGLPGLTAVALAADYTMQPGDTLYGLAVEHYGDASYWHALKWYNSIQSVYTIPVGTPIEFPDVSVLEQVKDVLDDPNTTGSDKSDAIARMGGTQRPSATVNEGTGTLINYNAIDALGQRRVPTR